MVEKEEELESAFEVRKKVFIEEQEVPEEIEMDGKDKEALHVLALDNEKAVGTARMRTFNEKAKLERMAILKEYRGKGIGKKMLRFLLELAQEKRIKKAILHSQCRVQYLRR